MLIGIGDDAASLRFPAAENLLFCSDAMVENIHFDLNSSTAADLGHKSIAACLSDIAAMNGRPLYALISIALPKKTAENFLEEFYASATSLSRRFKFDIVGGDLTASKGGIFIDVSLIGHSRRPIARATARVGDILVVSGFPGTSHAGLEVLQRDSPGDFGELTQAHLRPEPRFDLLQSLTAVDGLCTSLIDLSDGLSSEIYHLAESSQVGFAIDAAQVPIHPQALTLAKTLNQDAYEWAMSGGEDYELLATLNPEKVKELGDFWSGIGRGFTKIGYVTEQNQGIIENRNGQRKTLVRSGYDHFASKDEAD